MSDLVYTLFGDLTHEDNNLSMLQMSCRAVILFFVTLFIIRISGMRAFGRKSAFDAIIVIMLGAVLSRAVVGANPFFPTVTAGLVFGIIHRFMGWLSVKSDAFGILVKGRSKCLYEKGKFNHSKMLFTGVSTKDIMEAVHSQLNTDSLDDVKQIFMERTGEISIIKK